jgi:DNA replication protein DnaC
MRSVQGLIALARRYGAERVDATCVTALAHDMLSMHRGCVACSRRAVAEIKPDADAALPPGRFLRPAGHFALNPTTTTTNHWRIIMNPDVITTDLKQVLKRLKLGPILDTLPERLALARQQKMPHQDFLLLILSDEVTRRDSVSAQLRAQRARLDPAHQLEAWDATANVRYDVELWNELCSLRFLETHAHVAIVGPVGVGKTFLAHALGAAACRRGYSVLAHRCDRMLKALRHARLDATHEAELRKLLSVDLLILDDFGLDAMDATESRDIYELFTERHRRGSIVVTSNRGPTSGSPPSPIPCGPRPPSIDSPATPTTWSSTASPTAPVRNRPSHARRKLDPGGRPERRSYDERAGPPLRGRRGPARAAARPRRLPELDQMIDEALQSRLELRSLKRAIDGYEEGIKATRASYYPRLDAFAEATYANPNQRFFPLSAVWRGSWSAGVQLSYSINQTLMTKAQVRGLKADKRELILQAELMRRGIKMEVVQAYGDRMRAMQAIELNTRSLASSAEAYRVASENYKAGAATTNDIIDAEGDQIQAGLRTINAHIDLRVANARLLYASGRRNPSTGKSSRK